MKLEDIENLDKKYDKIPMVDLTMDDIVAAGNVDYQLLTFSWALIDVCNYQCSYCSAEAFNQHTFFKQKNLISVWKNVVKALSLNSIQIPFTVELLGGEPTLHPNMPELVRSLCDIDRCVQVEITTNLSKPLSYFKQFDVPETSKVDIIASYHPEYYTEAFFEKVVELNKCEHITIVPLINLLHEEKTWDQTLDLIDRFKANGVNVSLNLLYAFPGNDFAPSYTKEFWDIFEPLMKESLIDERDVNRKTHAEEVLTKEKVEKFFGEDLTGPPKGFTSTHREAIDREKDESDEPIIFSRSRWMRLDENTYRSCRCDLMISDIDIYKNKLYEFKGWKCRPLMWEINMDGSIVNHCTQELIPIHKMNKDNLAACIECPLTYCDCNTKYQYVKQS